MAEATFQDLSDADLDALLNNRLDSLSDEGLTFLSSLSDDDLNSLSGEAPAPQEQDSGFTIRGNIEKIVTDLSGDPALGAAASKNPLTDFTLGVGRMIESTSRGIQQLASSPEEAKALGLQEEKSRELFAEIDEGIGAEDAGEALMFLGTLAIPGGAPVQAANAGLKIANGVRALGGTLGGNALLVGLLEGSKATVEGESRLANTAQGAGLTLAGGHLTNGLFRVLGATATSLGLGQLLGASRSVIRDGLFRRWMGGLFGKGPKAAQEELRLAAATGGQEVRQLTKQAAQAEARAAEKAGEGLGTGNPVWESWLDIVKGPKSPSTGRRLKGSSLEGTAGSKAARENPALDVVTERNRAVATLMDSAVKRNDETGEILFDVKAAMQAWESLKTQPGFREVYGKTLASGAFSPNKVAKSVDSFFENLLTAGQQTASHVTPSQILRAGADDVIEVAEKGIKRVRQVKAEGVAKPTLDETGRRAVGVGLEQMVSQEFLQEAQQRIQQDGWVGFLDYFVTLEDAAR